MNYQSIVVVLLLMVSGEVVACSCAEPIADTKLAVTQAYKGASSVVVAQVASIEREKIRKAWMDKEDDGLEGEITHFVTVDSLKGVHGQNFSTKTVKGAGMCDMSFDEGRAYLLYLYGPDNKGYYSASVCSRSVKLEGAKEDLNVLKMVVPK